MTEQALSGLKVLELCHFVAGPYCTKLLADFGAEVIKIEPPETGDNARIEGPFPGDIADPEKSGLFLYLNTSKQGVTLNLNKEEGKQIFRELIKWADVLVEDNPPGMMKELGLDYDSLKDINPQLVMTSLTPFGQTGPYSQYKAYHLNVFHASGQGYLLPSFSQNLEREPVKTAGLVGDYDCGVNAAVATMAGVYARASIGCGQYIDISQQECLTTMQRVEMGEYPNLGISENRVTIYGMTLGRPTRCKNGYVSIEAEGEHMWQGLVQAMGSPQWADEEWCRDTESRRANFKELMPKIQEWAMNYTKQEIEEMVQAAGCPVAPINTTEDLLASAQLKDREYFVDVAHARAGKYKYPGAPFKLSETPWQVNCPAPLLGEHNEEIYGKRLSYSPQEIARMKQEEII